jgi:hypothetical protein
MFRITYGICSRRAISDGHSPFARIPIEGQPIDEDETSGLPAPRLKAEA